MILGYDASESLTSRFLSLFWKKKDSKKIGYYITKMSFNQLGESNCLKIIINHYRDNIKKLEEISRARGTNLQVLLKSYNISYNNDNSEWNNKLAHYTWLTWRDVRGRSGEGGAQPLTTSGCSFGLTLYESQLYYIFFFYYTNLNLGWRLVGW